MNQAHGDQRELQFQRRWVEAALATVRMQEAAITGEVALRTRPVCVAHDDPADRFLAASADLHGLTLVTSDERLIDGKGYPVLANR